MGCPTDPRIQPYRTSHHPKPILQRQLALGCPTDPSNLVPWLSTQPKPIAHPLMWPWGALKTPDSNHKIPRITPNLSYDLLSGLGVPYRPQTPTLQDLTPPQTHPKALGCPTDPSNLIPWLSTQPKPIPHPLMWPWGALETPDSNPKRPHITPNPSYNLLSGPGLPYRPQTPTLKDLMSPQTHPITPQLALGCPTDPRLQPYRTSPHPKPILKPWGALQTPQTWSHGSQHNPNPSHIP